MSSTPPSTLNQVPYPQGYINPQALAQWQALLHQTAIQSHLGHVLVLPRWAEGAQIWKAF